MDNTLLEVGRRLCARRKKMGLTQDALAEKASVTAQTISYAELGKKAMRADTIIGVCDALEISADYLLFGNTLPTDFSVLSQKISRLSPEQLQCLEDIINSFIVAVTSDKNET